MNIINAITNFAMRLIALPVRLSLIYASKHPKQSSEKTLRKILKVNANTVYGREHHFSKILWARNADQLFRLFEHAVEASDYEAFRPYVERHKQGEPDVLIPGKPIMYATTSGTTSKPKFIPISARYMRTVYSRMSKMWIWTVVTHRPHWQDGKLFQSVSKVIEGYAPDGTVTGSVSGLTQKKIPGFIRKKYTIPACVNDIPDYTARYYTMMRLGVGQDITFIVTANPSTMLEFAKSAVDHFDEIIEDVENGTLSEKFDIPEEVREEITANLKPDPKRAEFLRKVKAEHPEPQFKDFWPNLQFLNTWKCGNTKIAADKVAAMIPQHTYYQEIGFAASECRFGLVLDDTVDTILFPNMNYYEFVEESDMESENPRFYRLHELKKGVRYCIYVTTFSGLYRYNMHDMIEVGGFFKTTPKIHLVQKVNGIVSITGEKLYEKQFIDAVHQAEEQTGMKVNFFIGFASPENSNYDFYYEFADEETSKDQASDFTIQVDKNLKEMNVEYKTKRDSMRLKMPHTNVLYPNSYEMFKRLSLKAGGRDGQFKLVLLLQDKVRQIRINRLVKKDTPNPILRVPNPFSRSKKKA
ncbi:MAG: GH3 auxin-responsive promoter family protein [Bacteroidales bacterium]|nr:GH3 auxin-responsive promoter family protein [Bacteroidales bacterium]